MNPNLSKFEKKIIDFLFGHYNQRKIAGRHLIKETKRLSKAKNDISSRIKDSVTGFEILSEVIKISNTTPDKLSQTQNTENQTYIRERYSDLPKRIISSTLDFDLIGEKDDLEYFKSLQRDMATDIFSRDKLKKTLDAIFLFHPQGIVSEGLSNHTRYQNSDELESKYYGEHYKKYYHDIASLLVKIGINEIKKNLHPDNDKLLIERLDFTVNMIRKLDYRVENLDAKGF